MKKGQIQINETILVIFIFTVLLMIGLIYFFKGDFVNASKNYLEAFKLNETIDHNKKSSIKSLCSYGYVEELIGHHNLAKEKMIECTSWILENRKEIEDDHDTYETIWPLYLYQKQLKQQDKTSKYLNLAYKSVGIKRIEKYHAHSEKDTHPEFFYCRDIIKAYESSLNQ